jgi:hypothetical protein
LITFEQERLTLEALVMVDGTVRLELTMDFGTGALSIAGDVVPISVGQCILDEAQRVLEEKRRVAAALQLRQSIVDQQADARLREQLSGGRQQ